jgi:hypothetical protein
LDSSQWKLKTSSSTGKIPTTPDALSTSNSIAGAETIPYVIYLFIYILYTYPD